MIFKIKRKDIVKYKIIYQHRANETIQNAYFYFEKDSKVAPSILDKNLQEAAIQDARKFGEDGVRGLNITENNLETGNE